MGNRYRWSFSLCCGVLKMKIYIPIAFSATYGSQSVGAGATYTLTFNGHVLLGNGSASWRLRVGGYDAAIGEANGFHVTVPVCDGQTGIQNNSGGALTIAWSGYRQ